MNDYIKFLGTAGARFVVSRQLRSSAGIWCRFSGKNFLIDPGPGTLYQCFADTHCFNPEDLEGIIISHRHIDHSSDLNIMTEAMTSGTFNKKGKVLLPEDAVLEEPVLYRYLREAVGELVYLKEGESNQLGEGIYLQTPVRHVHGVETYGLKFETPYYSVSFIVDSRPFDEIAKNYRSDILVMNVVLYRPVEHKKVQHLDMDSAGEIIKEVQPRVAVLTHFGMTMLKHNPREIAEHLSDKTGVPVLAASDGYCLYPGKYVECKNDKVLSREIKQDN